MSPRWQSAVGYALTGDELTLAETGHPEPELLVAVLAWQVVAVAWTAIRAEEAARRAGLAASGVPGRVVTVARSADVPGPLAHGRRLTIRATVMP